MIRYGAGKFLWPVGAFMCILLLFVFTNTPGPNYDLLRVVQAPIGTRGWQPILAWTSVFFAMLVAATFSAADLSRYSRSRRDAFVGYFVATAVGTMPPAAVGIYAAAATGNWNTFAAAAPLSTSYLVSAALGLGLFANALQLNATNNYSTGMAVVNVVPNLGRFWSTVVTGVLGITISTLPAVINEASRWISEIGAAFSPLIGIFLVDYMIIRRESIDVEALFDNQGIYRYFGGINPVAVLVTVLGYLVTKLLPTWAMPQLVVLLASALGYYVLIRLGAVFSKRLRSATTAA